MIQMRSKAMQIAFSLLILVIIVIQYTSAAPVDANNKVATGPHLSEGERDQIYSMISTMKKCSHKNDFNTQQFLSFVEKTILPAMRTNCFEHDCPQVEFGWWIANELDQIFKSRARDYDRRVISTHPSVKDEDEGKVASARLKYISEAARLVIIKKYTGWYPTFFVIMEAIYESVENRKAYKMLSDLYENRITPKKMIRDMYQGLQAQSLSFDSLCQFITDGSFYARWSHVLEEPNSPATTSVASSSADNECYSTNQMNCDFFSIDGNVLDIGSETFAINQQREEWQQHIYNKKPIDLQKFTSWLKDQIIPYMKNVGRHLNLLYHYDENHEFYKSALITVDKVLFLIKDFSLQHQKKYFFGYEVTMPDEFFNAVVPKKFFNSLIFFEFGVEFHTLLVQNNYLRLKMSSGDLYENIRMFIELSEKPVKLIKRFQSPMKLQSIERSPEEVLAIIGPETEIRDDISDELRKEDRKADSFITEIFKEFEQKTEPTTDDLEKLVMPYKDVLNTRTIAIGIGTRVHLEIPPAVDLLGVCENDVYSSSHPVFCDLKANRFSWVEYRLYGTPKLLNERQMIFM